MITEIEHAIRKQCWKSASAAGRKCYVRAKRRLEYQKATGTIAKPASGRLATWELGAQFHPHLVKKKAHTYALQLAKAINNHHFTPRPCLNLEIPKDNGKKRIISQYSVVDAAVSCWLYERLLAKNLHLLSPFAFAFRRDLTGADAIELLYKKIEGRARTFCVEIDFKNCFDEVNHKYLNGILQQHFVVTPEERSLIQAFLKGQYARGVDAYKKGKFKPRLTGIPQGSTISLFLANAVFVELDSSLDKLGITFARYADDIVVLADSYEKANSAANLIYEFSEKSGIPVNHKKSAGITLIAADGGEIATKEHFEYLGYCISPSLVELSEKRKKAIKKALSEIINRRLLIHPRMGDLSKKRFYGGCDWDLVVCLNELRRRIYGRGLREEDLDKELNRFSKSPRSLVSAHPFVNTNADYLELDGWLLGALRRAQVQRGVLVAGMKVKGVVAPSRKVLISGSWYKHPEIEQDTRLPSLVRAWKYTRRLMQKAGTSTFRTEYDSY